MTKAALESGATLKFDMGSEPNLNRGIAPEDRPYSFSLTGDAPQIKAPKKAKKQRK